jgi:translocation and assembly module TamA
MAVVIATTACGTVAPRKEPIVRNIEVVGAQKVSASDIKGKILTSETGALPFSEPQYFDSIAWEADLRRIERYYQARGYYQARVLDDEVLPVLDNQVNLRVTVREGLPTYVASLEISGLEAFEPNARAQIESKLPLAVGEIFEEDRWNQLKDLFQERLRERGYAEAVVDGDTNVDTETQKAFVRVRVNPGIRFRFGNVLVAADPNAKVPAYRIVEQAQISIKPDRWYSETAVAEAQTRIYRMGVFGGVKVTRGAPNRADGTVPVIVEVREAPFHTVRSGFGVSVDQTRTEGRVLAEYTNRDFYGGLRRLTLRGRVGWAFLPNILEALRSDTQGTKNGPTFNVTTEFEQPNFLHRTIRLQPLVLVERGLEPAYNYIGGKARLGLLWQPHPQFSIVPSYNFEIYELTSTQTYPGASLGLPDPTKLLFGCPNICKLSYLEQTIAWDRRDDRFEPRKGYYLGLSFQEGGIFLGGNFDYIRILPEARYYQSAGAQRQWTFSAKLRAGTIISVYGKSTPIITRFYSGGGNAMRGFANRRLSALSAYCRVVPPVDNPSCAQQDVQTVPVGGNGLFEGSLEVRYTLGDWVFAAFMDTGVVTPPNELQGDPTQDIGPNRPARLSDLKSLYYAVGLGIRYLTIVGPIRLDLAYRLNIGPRLPIYFPDKIPLNVPDQGCFGLGHPTGHSQTGGAPEGPCAFHLSIGEAF